MGRCSLRFSGRYSGLGIRYNPNIAGHINHDSDNYGRKYNGLQLRVDRRRAEKTIWMDLFDDDEGMYSAIKELILAVQHAYDFVLWCILEEEKKNRRRKSETTKIEASPCTGWLLSRNQTTEFIRPGG